MAVEWYHFKCQERMVEENVEMTYLEVTSPVEALKCPKCGAVYLTEETVTQKVNNAEEMLEYK
ncbi:MAG: hypothetical protein HYY30_08090 [Chloroflexi bacterium]|nr:hypothetical protein [Chloroflexota bacterium]